MDAATQLTITSVSSTLGAVLLAYIALRQAQLNKKVDVVAAQTNGILISKEKAKNIAEGKAAAAVEIAAAVIVKPP